MALLAAIAGHLAVAVENARLRRLAERAAVLEERERLARELHDSVTQLLYSLGLYAETGQRLAGAGEIQGTEDYLGRIGQTAQQALKEMRVLIFELRPPVLSSLPLQGWWSLSSPTRSDQLPSECPFRPQRTLRRCHPPTQNHH